MISDPQGTILALFLAFCRIGGCVMVLPGFSSGRVPPQIRLLLAAALSMAILPLLWNTIYPEVSKSSATYISLIFTETVIGLMYGMMARLYTLGLQFAGTVISMLIGFNAPGGMDVIEDSNETSLTSLISFCGLMILFVLDFHHYVLQALVESYSVIPFGGHVDVRASLISVTDTLATTTFIMLRLASPFLLYGLMFQISIGFINKLAPQIPIYFISTPYLLMGGLFMLYLSIAAMISQFSGAFLTVFNGH
ncbi:flagellar type III secretion system protein FliR [Agrobacterium sp. SHOUNA12C]|uniref:Flagellar biosynthetic protein FliR n=1 Tax=Rhizobium rhizogenes (strain K84 / ATCC BAA-868) TaxID=311403 RepID=B9J995_RHIR8|nr:MULTISPECIES: flagellar biosynthetic protein FliR [Rhizobium]ACM25497.1 flagellar byosinthesis transmembrane protein [Rhizobium rhizogenes K84]KAA6486770.1 flagellar type III secretion system protein FliR [Agrobacterium sp. ICMP 7243]MCJ9722380.1 flagellar type III secretion system protein FliR [Agrobacterium sp. BETTINA12B]MCJ9757587.1 flagellar type III secretion system protein FliR [Agrobacterium sp. SHOUNA12C]OCJ21840.1 flagellar biosynthetic protein FliR [Agrobacterium sp. B131/95]